MHSAAFLYLFHFIAAVLVNEFLLGRIEFCFGDALPKPKIWVIREFIIDMVTIKYILQGVFASIYPS